jgi:hypothetical protein
MPLLLRQESESKAEVPDPDYEDTEVEELDIE